MKAAKTRHVFSNQGRQWAITGAIYLVFFFFFIWYHDVRGKPFTLFTTEKCTAIASAYCLSLALSLGPLSRFFAGFDGFLPYRRPLGITAALMTIPHVILVLVYLPRMDPAKYSANYFMSWYVDYWFTIVMGVLTFALFLVIAAYSFPSGIRKLGKHRWMILQKLAYLVMIFVVLHLLSMGKIPGNWIKWLDTHDWPVPPGSFPTMMGCLIPQVLKVADLIAHGDSLAAKPDEQESS